jgi:hypothetical protein
VGRRLDPHWRALSEHHDVHPCTGTRASKKEEVVKAHVKVSLHESQNITHQYVKDDQPKEERLPSLLEVLQAQEADACAASTCEDVLGKLEVADADRSVSQPAGSQQLPSLMDVLQAQQPNVLHQHQQCDSTHGALGLTISRKIVGRSAAQPAQDQQLPSLMDVLQGQQPIVQQQDHEVDSKQSTLGLAMTRRPAERPDQGLPVHILQDPVSRVASIMMDDATRAVLSGLLAYHDGHIPSNSPPLEYFAAAGVHHADSAYVIKRQTWR